MYFMQTIIVGRLNKFLYVLATSIILINCPNQVKGQPKDRIPCPHVYLHFIGDLPGGQYGSESQDISGDGIRVVGGSYADDPGVAIDGDKGYSYHPTMAFGWTRPCEKNKVFKNFKPSDPTFPTGTGCIGLNGLGYYIKPGFLYVESYSHGISPDGKSIVGYCNIADGNPANPFYSVAVLFRLNNVINLNIPATDPSSDANDVSDRFPGHFNRLLYWQRNGLSRSQPDFFNGVIVGWSGSRNHPNRTPGGRAVYWDPNLDIHDLPLPSSLPNSKSIISSEAVCISDDGLIIGGNLYYASLNGSYLSYPCVWKYSRNSHAYELVKTLDDVPMGFTETRLTHVSGDGNVMVGYGIKNDLLIACRWSFYTTGWGNAEVLPLLPGMTSSAAAGVDFSGDNIVGTCLTDADNDYGSVGKATLWRGTPVVAEDIVAILKTADPAIIIPADRFLEANRISSDGTIITGTAFYTNEYKWEGWVCKIKR